MSDTHEETVAAVEKTKSEPQGPAYQIVFLKVDEMGAASLWLKPHTLSAKVYDRRTAIKYAAYEIQKFSEGYIDPVVAVINPAGRCVAVLGRAGKPVRPVVSLRVKKALTTLMPDVVKPRRRTSRPLGRSAAKASTKKRRTSRPSR